jgi:hypothetical protein
MFWSDLLYDLFYDLMDDLMDDLMYDLLDTPLDTIILFTIKKPYTIGGAKKSFFIILLFPSKTTM